MFTTVCMTTKFQRGRRWELGSELVHVFNAVVFVGTQQGV